MATEPQKSRRRRAIEQIQKRIDHWSTLDGEVEFDGNTVNATQKLEVAQAEMANIMNKVR